MFYMRFSDSYQAEQALADLCAANSEPKLEPHELRDIVMQSRTADADGRLVSDANYELTVDMNRAAAVAWGRKATKAASQFDFSSDNQRFNRSQILNHCLKMTREFQRRQIASWKIESALAHERFNREVAG